MIRISRIQIQALADRIKTELKEEFKKKKEELISTKEFQERLNKYPEYLDVSNVFSHFDRIKTITTEINFGSLNRDNYKSHFINKILRDDYKFNDPTNSYGFIHELENKITVNTIEIENLTDLIKTIKEAYL